MTYLVGGDSPRRTIGGVQERGPEWGLESKGKQLLETERVETV